MKKNKNNNQKKIIKTTADAQLALDILLQDVERKNIQNGIFAFLDKLENPRVNDLFERYPDLLQEYGLEETLNGTAAISGNSSTEIKTAGLLSGLQMILLFYADLSAHPNDEGQRKQMLQYMLKSIACGDFVGEILLMVIDVVGADYYLNFRNKIDDLEVDLEQLNALTDDPELQEHLDLMTWFCLVRVFLESVYVLYDTAN